MKMHNAFLSQFRKFFIVIIVSLRGIIYAAYNHRIESAADERIFVPSFVNYRDNGKSVRDPIILLIISAIKLREKASILNYILQRENKYQENSFSILRSCNIIQNRNDSKVTTIRKLWYLTRKQRVNKELIERRKITYISNPIGNSRKSVDRTCAHTFSSID